MQNEMAEMIARWNAILADAIAATDDQDMRRFYMTMVI
jgi:hypothetical protein